MQAGTLRRSVARASKGLMVAASVLVAATACSSPKNSSPAAPAERIAQVAQIASGYVYYVSLAGVTGSGALNVEAVAEKLPAIREKTGLPVGVGFGIRDAATAKRIAVFADAVVVGSRIIEEIEKSTAETACTNVKALVADIRRGVDEVKK